MESTTSQGAVWPYMAVPPQESGKADFSLPAIAVGMQIHLLVFDRSPQSLQQDVVEAALFPRPADLDYISLQPAHEISGGELAALVGVEDFWPAAASHRYLQSIETLLCVQAVGGLPAEHVAGEQIHGLGPDLIHSRNHSVVHQAGYRSDGSPETPWLIQSLNMCWAEAVA